MTGNPLGLPSLDCHAHIAPDVTRHQLDTLGHTHIFAVTRSLSEAEEVAERVDSRLTWGIGIHPALPPRARAITQRHSVSYFLNLP